MAGVSAAAKEYLRVALVKQGIPSSLADEMVLRAPAGTNFSLGATPHDPAALTITDAFAVSVGFPSQGPIVEAAQMDLARLSGLDTPTSYPPCTSQTSTNYVKNV
jgi:hypothetical protein